MNQKIQVDYDQLAEIAAQFSDEGEAVERLTRTIDRLVNDLCSGGWIGRGADRFYGEMFEVVLPALRRLGAALYDSGDATSQISRIMQEAEETASKVFVLSGPSPVVAPSTTQLYNTVNQINEQMHDQAQQILDNLRG